MCIVLSNQHFSSLHLYSRFSLSSSPSPWRPEAFIMIYICDFHSFVAFFFSHLSPNFYFSWLLTFIETPIPLTFSVVLLWPAVLKEWQAVWGCWSLGLMMTAAAGSLSFSLVAARYLTDNLSTMDRFFIAPATLLPQTDSELIKCYCQCSGVTLMRETQMFLQMTCKISLNINFWVQAEVPFWLWKSKTWVSSL